MIVPVRSDAPDLLERVRAIRLAGDAPLVGDARWPSAQWAATIDAAAQASAGSDTAWAALTSGSSGRPRIVLRSAASWQRSFDTVSGLLGGDDSVVALPASAASSLTLFSIAHALAGGPTPALGATHGANVTSMHGTPHALRTMLDRESHPALRAALVGGSHLDAALRKRATDAGIRVVGYYGAAELSFVALDRGDGLRAFPGVELDVRDGLLWVRSPFVASGYVGGDGPLRRDGEWASVGDRAELHDGRLRLRGRSDDAVLSASATIIPEEVEEVLRAVPGVRDAIVFGWPRARVGSLVAAFVEFEGEKPSDLRATVGAQLAPTHRPRRWFHGEIPRTASGKPARAEAIRRALEGEVSRVAL